MTLIRSHWLLHLLPQDARPSSAARQVAGAAERSASEPITDDPAVDLTAPRDAPVTG